MEVVICSGEVNRYGYRNIPSGARLDSYNKCPILLHSHNTEKPSVGTVGNIHVNKAGHLVGTLEFDEGDPLAVDLQRKYSKGYMKAVSMSHTPLVISESAEDLLPGQSRVTVKEWELDEISCVNFPADRDAVTLSGSKNENDLDRLIPKLQLSIQSQPNKDIKSMNKISKALGLSADATEDDILNAVTKLNGRVQAAESARIDTLIDSGKLSGVITDENEDAYRKLSAADYDNASKLVKLASAKATKEESTTSNTLTAKSIIDAAKKLTGKDEAAAKTETFEKLSKENPKKLNQIRKEDPARYQKLVADYTAASN